jgi:hypothetical protein
MKISNSGHRTFGICAAMVILAGCGGSQLGAPGAMPLGRSTAIHPAQRPSWMSSDAMKQDLLYISDTGSNDVYVYSYPSGTLKGTLTGFDGPAGECVDKAGDVFITNYHASNVLEYAHGGVNPIATLSDAGYQPEGCSVDPTTGNLAVTNYDTTSSGQGNLVVYRDAKDSHKKYYVNTGIYALLTCNYDNRGNLFVDGNNSRDAFAFAELPSGSTSFKKISLNQSIQYAGAVQWDGAHVAVGAAEANVIYQFTISGKKGTEVGSTPLMDASNVVQFWIQGSTVIGADAAAGDVGFWNYPQGGSPTKTITGFVEPIGATVSRAR